MTGLLANATAASLVANLVEAGSRGNELAEIYQSFRFGVVFMTSGSGHPGNRDVTSQTCARKLTDTRVSRSRLRGS